jgi:hypothetical protein
MQFGKNLTSENMPWPFGRGGSDYRRLRLVGVRLGETESDRYKLETGPATRAVKKARVLQPIKKRSEAQFTKITLMAFVYFWSGANKT